MTLEEDYSCGMLGAQTELQRAGMLIAKYGADNKSTKLAVGMEQVVLISCQHCSNCPENPVLLSHTALVSPSRSIENVGWQVRILSGNGK